MTPPFTTPPFHLTLNFQRRLVHGDHSSPPFRRLLRPEPLRHLLDVYRLARAAPPAPLPHMALYAAHGLPRLRLVVEHLDLRLVVGEGAG